jgi:hypothetical protein
MGFSLRKKPPALADVAAILTAISALCSSASPFHITARSAFTLPKIYKPADAFDRESRARVHD